MPTSLASARERAVLVATLSALLPAAPTAFAADLCAQISDGTIHEDDGTIIGLGPNHWGYDYEARTYDGGYCGSSHDAPSCEPYRDVDLAMAWNDAWLSNADCDHDGKLDRHYGFATYRGSGAELVNAMHGRYTNNGVPCDWYYVRRFLAAPADATRQGSTWVASDGTVLGSVIWTDFYIAESSYNEVCLADVPET